VEPSPLESEHARARERERERERGGAALPADGLIGRRAACCHVLVFGLQQLTQLGKRGTDFNVIYCEAFDKICLFS
jgi:hypothetical protein